MNNKNNNASNCYLLQDGGGDEHPCRRELTSQDIVLSRKGDMFSLWQRLDRYPPNCQVRHWNNATELKDMLLKIFDNRKIFC